MLQTALEFAEAAALADATSAAAASSAGRLARRAGEINRSAAWYRRAVRLARGDHNAYIRAQLGYGGVMLQLGNHEQASVAFRRASRMAIKYGSRGLAAQANHELLVIACDAGTYQAGAAAAEKALERYPMRHPRLPDLAHDYAQLLIRAGYFRASLPILQEVLAIVRQHERVQVHGALARSAGAVGERDLFEESCAEVVRAVSLSEDHGAHALIQVAAGARSLGEWELAERLGGDALDIATRRREDSLAFLAAEMLREVDARSGGEQGLALEAPLAVQLTVGAFMRKLAKRREHITGAS
jgi:tetratricopeptide (TPR) repeat protein